MTGRVVLAGVLVVAVMVGGGACDSARPRWAQQDPATVLRGALSSSPPTSFLTLVERVQARVPADEINYLAAIDWNTVDAATLEHDPVWIDTYRVVREELDAEPALLGRGGEGHGGLFGPSVALAQSGGFARVVSLNATVVAAGFSVVGAAAACSATGVGAVACVVGTVVVAAIVLYSPNGNADEMGGCPADPAAFCGLPSRAGSAICSTDVCSPDAGAPQDGGESDAGACEQDAGTCDVSVVLPGFWEGTGTLLPGQPSICSTECGPFSGSGTSAWMLAADQFGCAWCAHTPVEGCSMLDPLLGGCDRFASWSRAVSNSPCAAAPGGTIGFVDATEIFVDETGAAGLVRGTRTYGDGTVCVTEGMVSYAR